MLGSNTLIQMETMDKRIVALHQDRWKPEDMGNCRSAGRWAADLILLVNAAGAVGLLSLSGHAGRAAWAENSACFS
jgi:hypothetical protein